MRLEISYQDRLGLVRELIDLLHAKAIILLGMEVEATRIYFSFQPIDSALFSQLIAEIQHTDGVMEARKVTYMPSERGKLSLLALFATLTDPMLSINLQGKVELANSAALKLFSQTESTMLNTPIQQWFPEVEFKSWLVPSENGYKFSREIQGREFLVEAKPVWLLAQQDEFQHPIAVVIVLKPHSLVCQQTRQPALTGKDGFENFIGVSSALRQMLHQTQKLAIQDAPLLLIGETGTGKDMLARASHLHSARRDAPFLALNCAALPDDVAENELFGYAAGAYPNALESKKGFFEQASGGTVLLDEIAEMSPRMQSKLLRVLNDGTFRRVGEESEVHVDVRVICSTQKNLEQLVAKGEFRQDLFYRLNVLSLTLPPLRERREDILPLTHYYVEKFAHELGIQPPLITAELSEYLNRYHWPGNVRELKNSLFRALTQLEGPELWPETIALPVTKTSTAEENLALEGSLDEIISKHERAVLTQLYRRYPSTRKLAKRLGVSHTAIANKLREYGLNRKHVNGSLPVEK